jgi:hypothetical protein
MEELVSRQVTLALLPLLELVLSVALLEHLVAPSVAYFV